MTMVTGARHAAALARQPRSPLRLTTAVVATVTPLTVRIEGATRAVDAYVYTHVPAMVVGQDVDVLLVGGQPRVLGVLV